MSPRSTSPFSALREIDEESPAGFFGGLEPNGRCSRCIELGIHSISSRWQFAGDERDRIVPKYEGSMEPDIAMFMKRLGRDKDHPLVDICWCCNFLNLWSNRLGLSQSGFKLHDITKFGIFNETGRTDSSTNCQEVSRVIMADLPKRALPAARRVEQRPDYRRIRRWLKTCSTSHPTCRPDWSESLRTIRVIDVKQRSIVRLPKDGAYLALSYVWGSTSQPHFPVAAETLPFPLALALPKTIEHAVRVTRKLGFTYLWVDSVCIDQSNPEDKASQIEIMDRIYRGAYATIVALGSSSSSSGLCRVGRSVGHQRQIAVYYQGAIRYLSFLPALKEELDRSIWMTRGWTYQEGLLSHRCIYFGRNQVYFTCNEMSMSEDGDNSDKKRRIPRLDITRRSRANFQHRALVNPLKGPDVRQGMPLEAFHSVMREYNNRDLTNEEDTLDAVSGVLTLLKEEKILPSGFLFGLPLDYFRSALLWTCSSLKPLCRRETDRFPSWSWASWHLENPVIIEDRFDDYCRGAQPPLAIWLLDNRIEYGSRDVSTTRSESGVAMIERLQALYKSTTKTLFDTEKVNLPKTHQGFLYVEGILLKLPRSQTYVQSDSNSGNPGSSLQFGHSTSESRTCVQLFSIAQDALFKSVDQDVKYDFLLVSAVPTCIDGMDARRVWLHLLMLTWSNGVARRIGVAKILFSEDELVKLWPGCDACYRGFWLG